MSDDIPTPADPYAAYEPAEVPSDEALARLAPRPRRDFTALELALAAPRMGETEHHVLLWGIPEPRMFQAGRDYRELLDMIERLAEEAGEPLAVEAKALLAKHGRPRQSGNYGERYLDEPADPAWRNR